MSESQDDDFRAKGNKAFRDGDYKAALKLYTQAIRVLEKQTDNPKIQEDLIVLYRNRAQCNLNLGEFSDAQSDASYVLQRHPDDLKALFRRAQAAHKRDDLQRAYEDALRAYRQAPQNAEIGALMKTVYEQLVARRIEPNASSSGKLQSTLEKLAQFNAEKASRNLDTSEHYLDVANNYLVLCRDEPEMGQLYTSTALDTVCTFAQTALQLETEASRHAPQPQPARTGTAENGKANGSASTQPKKPITQAALRCLATLSKHDATSAMRICTQLRSLAFTMLDDSELSSTASLLLNNALRIVSGIDEYRAAREDYEAARRAVHYQGMRPFRDFEISVTAHKQFVNDLLATLTRSVNSHKLTYVARDTVIELLTHFVPLNDYHGLDYVKTFIGLPDPFWGTQEVQPVAQAQDTAASGSSGGKPKKDSALQVGLQRLLDVACACAFVRRDKEARLLDVGEETRALVGVCLAKVYDGLRSDAAREHFATTCAQYVTELLGDDESLLSKLEALTVITVLLEGPSDVGSTELGRQGLFEMVIAMLNVPEGAYRAVALDVLIAALRKPKASAGLIDRLVPTLKSVYRDDADEGMRVRALVGLCKLASSGGTDASVRPLADGSMLKLAASCKRFLTKPCTGTGDSDRIKHAIEGLAYLTLDADVKEELVEDTECMRSIWRFAESHSAACLFACAAILVNVTNAYDKVDPEKCTPEMIELARFAKQHVPEQHAKDSPEFVNRRITRLVNSGVASAMRALAERASGSGPRELLSRAFLAIITPEAHRGVVVQQGGGKALLSLAQDGNELGCVLAAQALAKLCITLNPQLALPGQRVFEVIRPLIKLLHIDRTGLQNFEALLALTNISSLNHKLRDKIVKEGAFPSIENYLFEDHALIKRAAAECTCNLIQHPEIVQLFEAENDRVKMLLVLCWTDDEEDIPLVRAASGALAQLTAVSTIACLKVLQVASWCEIFKFILSHPTIEVQHRAIVTVQNMVTPLETEETQKDSDKERTERERRIQITRTLVNSDMFELVLALTKFDDDLLEDSASTDNSNIAKQATQQSNNPAEPAAARKHIRKAIQDCAKDALEVARGFGLVEKLKK